MSGYLGRLVARANGSANVVRPLLTPAFAPGGQAEFVAEPFANASADQPRDQSRGRDSLPVAPAQRPTTRRSLPPSEMPPEPPARDGSPGEAEAFGQRRRTAKARAGAVPSPPTAGAADAPPAFAVSSRAHAAVGHSAKFAPLNRAQPERPSAGPRASSPIETQARVPSTPAAGSEHDGVEPAAIVRIAIGRIEVRANLTRTTAARSAGALPPVERARRFTVTPKLTLEEYLNRGEQRR